MTFDELLAIVSSGCSPAIRTDSRLVKKGDIFIALKGTSCDGHDFIDQALANGAGCIVCERRQSTPQSPRPADANLVLVEDSSIAAAALAQAVNGRAASKLTNLAVTGTNGKTTVAFLVRSIFDTAGRKCGLIGTVIYDTGSGIRRAKLTTPDCFTIARLQSRMVEAGVKSMIIEASSHALAQNRLAQIPFKAAAFTNLSGDHLDYHKTKQNYLDAKAKLFEGLLPGATAVLNAQSPETKQIAGRTRAKILFYAVDAPAELAAHIESMTLASTVFTIRYKNQRQRIKTPLLGSYNVANHLAAAGLALAAGIDLQTVAAGLAELKSIPGRLEKIESPAPFTVIIDYAHTDDALANVLSTLRPLSPNKLIVVFGCGGDRDRTKRPRMARAAEKFADVVIVTSDNPRTEDPDDIISEILAGFENGPAIPHAELRAPSDELRATKIIEPDRKKAIALAIRLAQKDDTILIAGKGHEDYQIIGKTKIHFSDRETALDRLSKLK